MELNSCVGWVAKLCVGWVENCCVCDVAKDSVAGWESKRSETLDVADAAEAADPEPAEVTGEGGRLTGVVVENAADEPAAPTEASLLRCGHNAAVSSRIAHRIRTPATSHVKSKRGEKKTLKPKAESSAPVPSRTANSPMKMVPKAGR